MHRSLSNLVHIALFEFFSTTHSFGITQLISRYATLAVVVDTIYVNIAAPTRVLVMGDGAWLYTAQVFARVTPSR